MITITRGRLRTVVLVIAAAALLVGVAACGRGEPAAGTSTDVKIAIVTRDFTNP